jgi:hypothetical protein
MKNEHGNHIKTILMTFDYETFLSDSGTFKNCILKPVDELIEYSIKYGLRSTYFIDALYYMRLSESKDTAEEARLLKDQLQRLVRTGNRIELHLHPQWLDAKRDGYRWEFPTLRYYRLHDLPRDKIADLFVSGVEILEDAVSEIDPTYKVTAFRAGGWCVQPFEMLEEGFIKSGIRIDSSVMPGMSELNSARYYDFMAAPDLPVYRFKGDPAQADENGPFFEIPITSINRSAINKILGRIVKSTHKEDFSIYGDGSGIPSGKSSLKRLFSTKVACTLDDVVPGQFMASVKNIDKPLITVMSHPKLLSLSSLAALKALLCGSSEKYRFATMNEIIQEIPGIGS